MAKKLPGPHSSVKNNGNSKFASASSNTFETLFGDIPEHSTSVSVFSYNNPLRRKPTDCSQAPHQQQEHQHQLGLGFGSSEDVGRPSGDSRNLNAGETKKRKRNKEKTPNIDSDSIDEASETPFEIKKSKKGELGSPKNSNLGSDSKVLSNKGKEKKGNLGFELKEILNLDLNGTMNSEIDKNGKVMGKRKRDELEAEYEARRYGVVMAKDGSGEGQLGGGTVGEKRKKLDSPEDMFISNEGFDDEDKLLRIVFVGNLPLKVKKKGLLREFIQFGEVESVRIRSVPIMNSKTPRKTPRKGAIIKKQINDSVDSVHAYIVFKTEESVFASLSHNMAVLGGNHIRVDRACPPRKKLKGENALLYDNKRTVFVGNLPFDVKDEEIYQLFSGISNLESSIEAIRVIRDPGMSVRKGIAYVLFKTTDAANVVVKNRNLKIRDRELRLYRAISSSTPSKRKKSSSEEGNNSPSKKLAADFQSPESHNKMKTTVAISYQALQACTSGVQKKVHTKITEQVKLKSRTPKQAGKKRKLESQTPESSQPNKKKVRKFR